MLVPEEVLTQEEEMNRLQQTREVHIVVNGVLHHLNLPHKGGALQPPWTRMLPKVPFRSEEQEKTNDGLEYNAGWINGG